MYKNQTSVRGNVQDFLCPFSDMYITQGSNSNFSHKNIMANDVRGNVSGVRYEYYAPCDLKVIKIYPESGQMMTQSLNPVRFANGRIDYATIMTAHDNNLDVYVGKVFKQGEKLGNMGNKGVGTGVHCHIQVSQSNDTSWFKKSSFVLNGKTYPIYGFNNEYDLDECYFIDNTNILYGSGGNWKYLKDVPVVNPEGKNYANLPPIVNSWRVYDVNVTPVKKNAKGFLNPEKFGGLTYYIHRYLDNGTTAEIDTANFGRCKIYIAGTCCKITIDEPLYKYGEY